ncbi:MAG: c-type cytochrome [Candidatus Methylomirabilales bacterium]
MRVGVALLGLFMMAGVVTAQPESHEAVTHGEQVYRTFCWTCHGRYGRGDGPAAEYLAVRPPDLTDPAVLGDKSDRKIIRHIRAGKGRPDATHRPMVVITQALKEEALRDAIAYMRTLAVPGKHVSLLAGKDVYNTFCQVCHGSRGDGEGPAAKNLADVKPRDFTSKDFIIEGREEEVYRAIFMGAAKAFHGSPYMPEWRTALSPQQIKDVMEYLKTFKRPHR